MTAFYCLKIWSRLKKAVILHRFLKWLLTHLYFFVSYLSFPNRFSFPLLTAKFENCLATVQKWHLCVVNCRMWRVSHVLGLPDLYATNNSTHRTMDDWDIMDAGSYNNNGDTPPAYSAYERFFLGWLTPTVLNIPGKYSLKDLKSSNEAYIITATGTSNLVGNNPNPTFYLLENHLLKIDIPSTFCIPVALPIPNAVTKSLTYLILQTTLYNFNKVLDGFGMWNKCCTFAVWFENGHAELLICT